MGRTKALVEGLGIGALAMYFYDPERGGTRRALLRDKLNSLWKIKMDTKETMLKDARNRLTGFLYRAKSRVIPGSATDRQVAERIRARIGHAVSHPGAIKVEVSEGTARLSGAILDGESQQLIDAVWEVPGVSAIEHSLETHLTSEHIPALQGELRTETENARLTPGAALAVGVAGGFLALYGVSKRGAVGTTLGLVGIGLIAKSFSDTELKAMMRRM